MKKVVCLCLLAMALVLVVSCSTPTPTPAPATSTAPTTAAPKSTAPATSAPATTAAAITPANFTIATNPIGSNYYSVGLGLQKMWGEKFPMYKISVEPNAGVIVALTNIKKGLANISFTTAPTLADATKGSGDYKDVGGQPMRVLAALYPGNYTYFTSKKTGIKTIMDFVGKKIAYNAPTSTTTNVVGQGLLEYYKIKDQIPMITKGDDALMIDNIIQGKLDAYVSLAGSELTQFEASGGGIQQIEYPDFDKAVAYVNTKWYAAFAPGVLKKEKYGLSSDLNTVQCATYMVTDDKALTEETAYNLVKSLITNIKAVNLINPEMATLTPKDMVSYPHIVPWHPGAVKAYKEAGLWTPALEASQAAALAGKF